MFSALFFAIFPKSFKEKYPLAIRNFQKNSRRLTTHFDIYATLKDILKLDTDSLSNENVARRTQNLKERCSNHLPRGISLFLEIPEMRTCESAGIESHWCMCYGRIKLSTSTEIVKK